MNSDQIKNLLDSCFIAKNITEKMKQLPQGLKPRHIHTIDAISRLSNITDEVRISDVSCKLNVTTPSVTKLINELEEKKIIKKYAHAVDKRVILLCLTDLGLDYWNKYVNQYHTQWAKNLDNVSDDDVEIVMRTIKQLAKSMPIGDSYDT